MNYPGEAVEMLEGKELKVQTLRESLQKFGYEGFYTDETVKKVYKKGSLNTKYDALVGKVFKVISYKPNAGNYIIKLENSDIGTLYYKYDKNRDFDYHFEVVGGLTFPDGFFCKYNKIDKTWNSAAVKYDYVSHTPCTEDICLYGDNNDFAIHVLITASADRKETGLKGLTLVLENGKEVSFPEASVDVESATNMYNYRTSADVNQQQLLLLKESPIAKKIVGNKEQKVEEGRLIMEYIKCLAK
ncbi:hypothetical protein Q766_16480 [Flavobacterium subsaxonicum WB 4.1-42 = DSM 21790]|uniref:Uncharacterized protein n=2 Tax=Flavobacterium TaxID=237 RepID=A0A0A2MG23_9FLAO|nr:hypothetical protein Q766_16480 [Flavobacterium subsaxonicum WB 4.1-42 = DSM 21790]